MQAESVIIAKRVVIDLVITGASRTDPDRYRRKVYLVFGKGICTCRPPQAGIYLVSHVRSESQAEVDGLEENCIAHPRRSQGLSRNGLRHGKEEKDEQAISSHSASL